MASWIFFQLHWECISGHTIENNTIGRSFLILLKYYVLYLAGKICHSVKHIPGFSEFLESITMTEDVIFTLISDTELLDSNS